jgi:hypothetical protein
MQRLPQPMEWLSSGIPLSLLIDLLDPAGPDSRRICRDEPADTTWIPHRAAA